MSKSLEPAGSNLPLGDVTDMELSGTTAYVAIAGKGVYFSNNADQADAGTKWVEHVTLKNQIKTDRGGIDLVAQSTRIEMSLASDGFTMFVGLIGNVTDVSGTGAASDRLMALYRYGNPPTGPPAPAWRAMDLPSSRDVNWTDANADGLVQDAELSFVNNGLHPGGQGNTHFSIVIDPNNSFVVYVGGAAQPTSTTVDRNGDGSITNAVVRGFPEIFNQAGLNNFVGRIFRGDAKKATGTQWEQVVGSGAAGTAPHADSRWMIFDKNGNLWESDDGGVYFLNNPNNSVGKGARAWVPRTGCCVIRRFIPWLIIRG